MPQAPSLRISFDQQRFFDFEAVTPSLSQPIPRNLNYIPNFERTTLVPKFVVPNEVSGSNLSLANTPEIKLTVSHR